MMEGNAGFIVERESQVKKVKRALDNWREISLLMNSVLLWKNKFYPWLIVVTTTLIFLAFAFYSPSFLTSVGFTFIGLTVLDYFGPSVSTMIWKHEDWTVAKEREFEDICRSIAGVEVYIKQSWLFCMDLKATRPYMYFLMSILLFLFLALLGNSLNNTFILYIISLSLAMTPGMLHYGILQKYYSIAITYLANFLRSFNSSKTKLQ